jgi:hypothetical protein
MGSAARMKNLVRACARRVRAMFGLNSEVGLSLRKVTKSGQTDGASV